MSESTKIRVMAQWNEKYDQKLIKEERENVLRWQKEKWLRDQ